MPTGVQWLLALAVTSTALGVLWRTVGRPIWKVAGKAEDMLPLMLDLTETFRGVPHAFAILEEIVSQLRTNSGSSLLDIINKLKEASDRQEAVSAATAIQADALAVGVEASRQLAVRDREELRALFLQVGSLTEKVDTGLRAIASIQYEASGVASDLVASHQRADAADGSAGEAADAASRSPRPPPWDGVNRRIPGTTAMPWKGPERRRVP